MRHLLPERLRERACARPAVPKRVLAAIIAVEQSRLAAGRTGTNPLEAAFARQVTRLFDSREANVDEVMRMARQILEADSDQARRHRHQENER